MKRKKKSERRCSQTSPGSPSRTRTYDTAVNSRVLYRLSYGGINRIRQRPILPGRLQPSTFGAKGLNFCVRDGNRWIPLAIATGNLYSAFHHRPSQPHNMIPSLRSFLRFQALRAPSDLFRLDQALDRLVSLSSMHCCTSTCDLSPLRLKGVLLPKDGISYLEDGFTLRCFQRFSFPYLATQPCPWRNNWCTIGTSIPVLSY